MPDMTVATYLLIGFMIVGSIVAIETTDLLSSVICIGAVGFALSVIDLLLAAPDLGLTLGVVEILTLVVLIRVVSTRRDTYHATSRDTLAIAVVVGGLVFVLTLTGMFALDGLAAPGSPVMLMSQPYLDHGLAANSAVNYVTSILIDFRGYDTLGEASIIFVAIVGVYAVLRPVGRIRAEGAPPAPAAGLAPRLGPRGTRGVEAPAREGEKA